MEVRAIIEYNRFLLEKLYLNNNTSIIPTNEPLEPVAKEIVRNKIRIKILTLS